MHLLRRTTLSVLTAVAVGGTALLGGPAMAATAAPSAQDIAWMQAAHQSNLTEIASGTAAQTKASSADVKQQGQTWISDHTKLDADLTAAAAQLGVKLPAKPNATQQAELAQASQTSGSAFDALFLKNGTAGHQKVLAAGKMEIAEGSGATVVALATAAGPVVQRHLTALLAAQGQSSPTSVDA